MRRSEAFIWNPVMGSGFRTLVIVVQTHSQKVWALKHAQQCIDSANTPSG
ncbi:MAG: hypothetical protein ACFFAN_06880 [Promethearchaeota archaeon]